MQFKTAKTLFFLVLITLLMQPDFVAAQSTWARTYGGSGYDAVNDIQQTSDGGFVVAGTKDSSPTSELWIMKLDAAGVVQWEKTYGGAAAEGFGNIQQTSDGGFIVAGITYSFGVGFNDFWVVKLDASGNVEWENSYGGSSFEFLSSIQQTSDGGFIVSGSTMSFGSGGWDGWLLKLNSTGTIEWQNTYGGINGEGFESAEETPDGGFITGGVVQDGSAENDLWLVKVDANGTIQWQKSYGISGNEFLQSFDQTSDGGFIVAAVSVDILLLKLDSSGNIQWQKLYNATESESPASIHQTSDDGYALVGGINLFGHIDLWMMKVDSAGNIQWQKSFDGPGDDYPSAIRSTLDGGYIVAGATESFGAGSFDFWVLRTDASGNVDSECSFGNPISFTSTDGTLPVQDTTISSITTAIVPIATNAIVANSQADIDEQCGNEPPAAQNDFAITSEDVAVTIDVLANDIDPDPDLLTITAFTQGSNGTVTDNGDGTVTYSPDAGFNGSDSFSYILYDGMVSDVAVVNVIVTAGNDPPVAVDDFATTDQDTPIVVNVMANDSDPDGSPIGVIAVTQGSNGIVTNNGDGTVTYTPNSGYAGNDSFSYTVSDGQFTDIATVIVTITAQSCLLCDDFENGVVDANWIYNRTISAWSEPGGYLTASTNARSTAVAGPFFPGCTLCSVSATMQTSGGFGNRVWLFLHYSDNKNFVELQMKEEFDLWILKVRQNKKIIAKGKVLRQIDPNVIYQAKILYDGIQYQAFVDGELVIALDVPNPVSNGTVGFKVKRTTGKFGYIEVMP